MKSYEEKGMEYRVGTKVFKDWEITKEIGQGGFGTVFEIEKITMV